MLQHLTRLFTPAPAIQHAYALYAHLNQEARNPQFYSQWGVPDTLDGRFEMILLHMFAYVHTMKQSEGDTTEAQRLLIEAFFEDMDRSVRELGVGDTGVSRRVKAMANAFYGRIHAFEKGVTDEETLHRAIRTNTYGTVQDDAVCHVDALAAYLHALLATLKASAPVHEACYLETAAMT
jgi:cytochrome b pre-mRNA-processing protein 3